MVFSVMVLRPFLPGDVDIGWQKAAGGEERQAGAGEGDVIVEACTGRDGDGDRALQTRIEIQGGWRGGQREVRRSGLGGDAGRRRDGCGGAFAAAVDGAHSMGAGGQRGDSERGAAIGATKAEPSECGWPSLAVSKKVTLPRSAVTLPASTACGTGETWTVKVVLPETSLAGAAVNAVVVATA